MSVNRNKDFFNRDKRVAALKRNKEWSSLTPDQQIERLDARLGKGKGAKRQRAKIQALMAESE